MFLRYSHAQKKDQHLHGQDTEQKSSNKRAAAIVSWFLQPGIRDSAQLETCSQVYRVWLDKSVLLRNKADEN